MDLSDSVLDHLRQVAARPDLSGTRYTLESEIGRGGVGIVYAAWDGQLGRRVALILTGYFAMFMMAGRPDNWYWGFVIAPLIPLGGLGYLFGRSRLRSNMTKPTCPANQ